MRCPRCQHENPPDSRFCFECGSQLALACASCGAELPAGVNFCNRCGQAAAQHLAGSRFASPGSYTPKHLAEKILTSKTALEGERKQVTVLFADLKGSMELLADRDPEEARKLLDPVLELMMEAVHRYEGTVNQVMGDGIMALFGAPLAHEDHAIRACYAALRMQEHIRRYAERARREHGALIHARVGVNSGEVVVRAVGSDLRMDYTAVGQTTHLAARLEQMAIPGSVLLSIDTLRLVEGYVEVEPLGPVPIKGLAAPVELYEVRGAGAARTRLQAAATRGLSRFVGRDPEMEHLRAAQEQAATGHGQVVAVVGEPGVGKSRLFYEFIRSHRTRGWLILESASVSYGKATAYLPVIDLLKTYFRIEPRDDARAIREKVAGKMLTLDRALEDGIPAVLALLDTLPEGSPFRTLEPPDRRRRTLTAVKALLLRESQVQPLVLVFEDLHWIDGETQAILDGLMDSLPAAPILLLVNYRPEYRHGWGGRTYYRQLRIDPFAGETADELLRALLGSDPSLDPLKRLLLERTEGNPFFVEEALRALIETGVLAGEVGAHRLVRPVTALQVPVSVHALLASRIDRLAPEDKQLLETAAAIGKDVPYPLLAAVADEAEGTVYERLARVQAAELLYEARLFPEVEYTFKHALTHEVAYAGLVLERRRAVHARIVDAIEALYRDRLEEHIERLAHHARLAERWTAAVRWLRHAGDRARQRSANREAASLYEQALEALAHLPDDHGRAREALATRAALRDSLIPLADFGAILAQLSAAGAEADTLGDGQWLGRITSWRGESLRIGGDLAGAAAAGEHSLVLLQSHGGERQHIGSARFQLGLTYATQGRYRRAAEITGEAAAALIGEQSVPISGAQGWHTFCLATLGEFDEAIARGEQAVALSETSPLGYVTARIALLNGLGHAHLIRGEIDRAVPLLERGWVTALEHDIHLLAGQSGAGLGYARALQGRTGEGIELIEAAIACWRGTRRVTNISRLIRLHGEALLVADRPDEAMRVTAEALDLACRQGERGHEADALRVRGECLAGSARPAAAAARASLEQALALAEELEMRPLAARCRLGLGRVHRTLGHREPARAQLEGARTLLEAMGMRRWRAEAEEELKALG